MVKLVGGDGPVDMFGWDLTGIADSTPVVETATQAIFNNAADHEVYTFGGKGFTYDKFGQPTGGVIKSFELETNGDVNFTITGMKLKVTDLLDYVQHDDLSGLMSEVMGKADNIKGSALGDTLGGFGGDDVISGGKGIDVIWGGLGADTLTGGAKDGDIFRYLDLSESNVEQADTITDLAKADVIDLGGIDANANKGGDQRFTLVQEFSHHAGELMLVYDEGNDRTELRMDVDGDAETDGLIYLSGDQTAFHHFVL